jgi:Ca-activated chloride channel family protein
VLLPKSLIVILLASTILWGQSQNAPSSRTEDEKENATKPESKTGAEPASLPPDSVALERIKTEKAIYPLEAQRNGVQGRVLVKFLISETGDVESAEAVRGDPLLAPAAVAAAKKCKFKPYIKNGRPVKVSTTIPFDFALADKVGEMPTPAVPKDLMLVNVAVTDSSYRPLDAKLRKEDFLIFEDKQQQEIQYFSAEDTPISLGILFDVSGSMKETLDLARRAVIELLQASNPQDEVFLIAFSEEPEMIFDFTPLKELKEIPRVEARKRTALLDAVYLGIEKMRGAHNARRVLLMISDGEENQSHYTDKEINQRLRETDVQLFAICIPNRKPPTLTVPGSQILNLITDPTGGLTVCAENPNEISFAARTIAAVLRNQYVLGYRPNKKLRNGRWRKIRVKLVHAKETKDSHVYARAGYYAPGGAEPVPAKP